MIDIVIPVLARPANAQKVYDSIKASTTVEHTVIFVVSYIDREEQQAVVDTGVPDYVVAGWEPGPADGARKWNLGFEQTGSDFVFLAADDLEFTPEWDVEALKVAEQTGAGVIGTNDAMNPMVKRGRHSTHSLVRRSYIDEFGGTFDGVPGVVYSHAYDHQCVDNELCQAAKDRGQWAFARRSVVIHHHPFYDKGVVRDSTYDKALRAGSADVALYQSRLQQWSRQRRVTVL